MAPRGTAILTAILPALLGFAAPAGATEGAGPASVYVEGLAEHAGRYAFYVFRPPAGQGGDSAEPYWASIAVGGPADPGEAGVRVSPPPKAGPGEFRLVAVPRDLAEKAPAGDPAWFRGRPAGVIPVAGAIEVVPLRQSRGAPVLHYRLEKTADGFALTLLNPDRLAREREPDPGPTGPAPAGTGAQTTLMWAGLAVGVVVLVAAGARWWLRGTARAAEPGAAADRAGGQ
jgi:hypothetical protein